MTSTKPSVGSPAPPERDGGARWHPHRPRRHRYTPEERRRLLDALFPTESWRFGFWFMMTLSVVIATMGLTANSAAAVIGAMLIAPLMTPVMGLAAALSMGWGRKAVMKVVTVVVASVGSIALAYVLAGFVRDQALTTEVLIRTSPDGRDFLIALAAGLAGAYATAREDVSVALPGVAVAVALIPPLGVIGITLESGQSDLAVGALLLYVANLATIVLAGILVFLLTGFVPLPRLLHAGPRVVATVLVAVLAVVGAAIPLVIRSSDAADRAREVEQVNRAVNDWQRTAGDAEVEDIVVETGQVRIDLSGPGEPPDSLALVEAVHGVVGADAEVTIRWRTVSTVDIESEGLPDPEETMAEIERLVEPFVVDWLAAGGVEDQLDVTTVDVLDEAGSRLEIELAGTVLPPPVTPLAEALSSALDRSVEVQVLVIEREVFDPSTDPDPEAISRRVEAEAAIEDWATGEGVDVFSVDLGDDAVVIDVVGEQPPGPSSPLARDLRAIFGDPDLDVQVRFVPRFAVPETTTTTSTTTTTTTTTTTVSVLPVP